MKFEVQGYTAQAGVSVEVSEARYCEIKSAKETCLFAVELEEKFALMVGNFYEFETELLKLAEASIIWPRRNHDNSMLERLLLDQRLVNLLTACRLYLDQTDHGISTMFGNPSPELNAVKVFKNSLYDDCWGYRFMEALRNHVQHAGLAIHKIVYNQSKSSGSGENYVQFTITPQSSIRKLDENSGFKRAILKELAGRYDGVDAIDLRPLVREYVNCFAKLHEQLRQTISIRLGTDRAIYESGINEFSTNSEGNVEFPELMKQGEDGVAVERIALVADFLGYLDSLRMRNSINHDLSRSFASNTDQKR